MNRSDYHGFKRIAARVYQARTERLRAMKTVPLERQDDVWKAERARHVDALSAAHRRQRVRANDGGDPQAAGVLRSIWELCLHPEPRWIIPTMRPGAP